MTLEGIDNIERGDGLALSVLGVGDGIANDTFEEGLEDSTGLFVDHYLMNALVTVSLSCSYEKRNILAEIRLTPPRRARRRMAGLVIP